MSVIIDARIRGWHEVAAWFGSTRETFLSSNNCDKGNKYSRVKLIMNEIFKKSTNKTEEKKVKKNKTRKKPPAKHIIMTRHP